MDRILPSEGSGAGSIPARDNERNEYVRELRPEPECAAIKEPEFVS